MTGGPRQLWVTNDFPPRAGGIEQFVANLLAHQDPARVHVVASRWPGWSDHDATLPYTVERSRRPLLPGPALLRRVRAAAAAHRADVVVFGAAWPLAELAPRVGLPSVAFTHGHEAGMAKIGLGPLIRRVARRVDALGYISEFTRRELAGSLGGVALHHLPPGVDVDRFRPEVDPAPVRQRYGLGADQPVVACIGRLVARKGQDVLVEAWPRVRAEVPGAALLLVGSGPLEARLRRRVAALGLDGCVVLAGGIAAAELPAHHAAADLFAMPCRARLGGLDVEGLGIVYLEAQASGKPVIAGDSGGAPEALVPGVTGAVVDGRDADAVAAQIVRLLQDPPLRATMGQQGRAFVVERYVWPVIAERFRQVLIELAD